MLAQAGGEKGNGHMMSMSSSLHTQLGLENVSVLLGWAG